jgi:hypothetical protein
VAGQSRSALFVRQSLPRQRAHLRRGWVHRKTRLASKLIE